MSNSLNISKAAVLVFNSNRKQQASLLELAPNMPAKKVDSLLRVLTSRTTKLVRKTKLPLFQVNIDGCQDFGTQAYEAYQQLFELGFNSVIGVSNDCPTLQSEDLLIAANSLKTQQVVLGPAKDGGLYLFGLRKNQFSKSDFVQFNWQTKTLRAEVIEACVDKSVVALYEKSDMDTAADFLVAFRLKFGSLSDFFNQLFSFTTRIIRELRTHTIAVVLVSLQLRAPPSFVFERP